MKNWIALSREIEYHWLWQNPRQFQWWLQMLFMASWDDNRIVTLGKDQIRLRRGQICCSLRSLSRRWLCAKQTTINFLRILEYNGMIRRRKMNKFSIITIINYEKYQAPNPGKEDGAGNPDFCDGLDHFEAENKKAKKTRKKRAAVDHLLDHNKTNINKYNYSSSNALAREEKYFQGGKEQAADTAALDHQNTAGSDIQETAALDHLQQTPSAPRESKGEGPGARENFSDKSDHFEQDENRPTLDHLESERKEDRSDHFEQDKIEERSDHLEQGGKEEYEKFFFDELAKAESFADNCAAMFNITPDDVRARIPKFRSECQARGHSHTGIKDLRSHFINWLRIALRCEQQARAKEERQRLRAFDNNRQKSFNQSQNDNSISGIRIPTTESKFADRRGSDVGIHTEDDFKPPF